MSVNASNNESSLVYLVRRVCAWCGVCVGYKLAASPGDTHTICARCSAPFRVAE